MPLRNPTCTRADVGIVQFEVLDRCDSYSDAPDCTCINAKVVKTGCRMKSPTVGETIEVYDGLECDFNVPDELLIGARGYAVQMKDPESNGCRWEVLRMCCLEES